MREKVVLSHHQYPVLSPLGIILCMGLVPARVMHRHGHAHLAGVADKGDQLLRLRRELPHPGHRRLDGQIAGGILADQAGQRIAVQLVNFQECQIHLCTKEAQLKSDVSMPS